MQGQPLPSVALGYVLFPLTAISSWWVLDPRQEAIILHYGTLTDHVTKSGVHFHNSWGREIKFINTSQRAFVLPILKITDRIGNPVLVSAVITCRVVDAKKALLNVTDPFSFVETQATAILKEVVSEFSYDELKTETESINTRMLKMLQPRVDVAGVIIQSCTLNELNYSSEIAKAMLKKQQCIALIEARNLLVTGSIEIAKHTIEKLKANGVDMVPSESARLVRSMIVVCTGDTKAQPILNL